MRLCFGDRFVGRALREQQRALKHLGVVAARPARGGAVGRLVAGAELLHLAREVLDGHGRALEQVVDLVAVEAAKRLLDLAPAELLRCDIHGGNCSDGYGADSWIAR